MTRVIVTGVAGFIGSAVAGRLLANGMEVVGIDNLNPYYSVDLKMARLAMLRGETGFEFLNFDVAQPDTMRSVMARVSPTDVIHLAAQAGVRYSLVDPFSYERANVAGHLSVLEACRHCPSIRHLVYASSSSVYGSRSDVHAGFRETDRTDSPASLYAATKKAVELLSESYSSLFGLNQTGLRFFTAYGPYGRPDMAYFSFADRMVKGQHIEVFGDGSALRDFTYIDDIVSGILGVLTVPPENGTNRVLNIGAGRPETVLSLISALERHLSRTADIRFCTGQAGDVPNTFADISGITDLTGYKAETSLEKGVERFVHWFRSFYSV